MRTKLINKKTIYYDYNNEPAEYDEYNYICPCGKGKIVETHDETPGNREHLVCILCEKCSKEFKLDLTKGIRSWEVIKIEEVTSMENTINQDNWTKFLNKLNDSGGFDTYLKEYLEAIKYISEISVECIDLLEERENINEYLKCIVQFIESYSEDYYEIGLIKGFRTNEKLSNGAWKIDGRDYYYYIADQKMKASVYYVRYLNYIDNHVNILEEAKQELQIYINIIKEMIGNDIVISEENIISVIDEAIEATNENYQLRQKCIKCIDQIRANDIGYLKYMLFNNMMREIRYIGAAYQYLWHWNMKTKNLFRYVSYDGEEMPIEDDRTKKNFLQEMFNNVISHMNRSSRSLCSYSEDPYIDIFKYLKIMKNQERSCEPITSENQEIVIKIDNLENSNKSRFDFIKEAHINSIYREGESQNFYDFVQDGRKLKKEEKIAYAVEMYPELPAREKNSKETAKNIKELLVEYLRTWVTDVDIEKLMSYVADDKEVVTYGKIEKNLVTVEANSIPSEVVTGTRYQMDFDKNELIYLLLKINNKYTLEKIVEQINIEIDIKNIDSWIEKALKGETQENYNFKGAIAQQITDKKKISIDFQCEVSVSFVNNIENPTLERCKKIIKEEIESKIKAYFNSRYKGISDSEHKIAEFILGFIWSEHQCPQYIMEYNEFEPEQGDPEISILKYVIFKRWNNAN
jgi:hypothetical protein